MSDVKSMLDESGYAVCRPQLEVGVLAALRDEIFGGDEAGIRCLLDEPLVAFVARSVGCELITAGILCAHSVAIQAIAFDKTATTNWKVTWHQDLMFPFAEPVKAAEYALSSVKDGVNYARPPRGVLEGLLAVRLHLDDCVSENGPLRIAPGTHRLGIIPSAQIQDRVAKAGKIVCTASAGQALLMRPLLLHASSKATAPVHRRVLHLVYHSGESLPEVWHRSLRPNAVRVT